VNNDLIIHDDGPEPEPDVDPLFPIIADPDYLLNELTTALKCEPEWKGHLGTWVHPAMIVQIQMPSATQPHCWFRFVVPDEMSIEIKVHEMHAEMLSQWLDAIKDAVKG
jgi:hypothetical protein